jgi:hypothetical protein
MTTGSQLVDGAMSCAMSWAVPSAVPCALLSATVAESTVKKKEDIPIGCWEI